MPNRKTTQSNQNGEPDGLVVYFNLTDEGLFYDCIYPEGDVEEIVDLIYNISKGRFTEGLLQIIHDKNPELWQKAVKHLNERMLNESKAIKKDGPLIKPRKFIEHFAGKTLDI